MTAGTRGVHLVRRDAPPHYHRLWGAEAPEPGVRPWSPQVWHVWPVPDPVSELQYRPDDHLHCVRHQEQRSPWDLQRGQTHRLHHVHHLHRLAGLCTHLLWYGAVYREGGKFNVSTGITDHLPSSCTLLCFMLLYASTSLHFRGKVLDVYRSCIQESQGWVDPLISWSKGNQLQLFW